MLLLKACPKCHGDVIAEVDEYDDVNLVCFQCGYSLRAPERQALAERLRSARQVAAARRAS